MESLTITFTTEEWAVVREVAARRGIGPERFVHDAVVDIATRIESSPERRRRVKKQSLASLNNPHEQAEVRRVFDQFS